MSTKKLLSVALALAGGLSAFAAKLGDPAPALTLAKTVKGEAVDLAAGKGKQTYVVEFWATWCGPCKTSIPHLTDLQKKFKDKGVTVIGISDETEDKVAPFVAKMAEKMDYVVAVDDGRKTFKSYMGAYGQGGIPTAFVVNTDGQVVWVGHPMGGLDEAIEKIVAGKFDIAAAQVEFAEREVKQKRMGELNASFGKYLQLAASGDAEKSAEVGQKLLELAGKDSMVLNAIAWNILTNPQIKNRDLPFALKVATAAVDASGGKEAAVFDTYARALYDNGKKAEAVEAQKKAVGLAKEEQTKTDMKKTLEKYEAGEPVK
jgi:peroxiredoxin